MKENDFAIVAAITQDVAQRLAAAGDAFTERQSEGIRTLLKGVLLACPRDKEIRPHVVAFAQALSTHLATVDDKVSPIRPSVATARNASIIEQAAALVKVIERATVKKKLPDRSLAETFRLSCELIWAFLWGPE